MKPIILASSSPRRRDLLNQIGLPFEIVSSNVEEKIDLLQGAPYEKVQELALAKGREVACKFNDRIIVSADTIVVIDGEILGKPKDDNEAFKTLKKLSGRCHEVITGFSVIDVQSGNYKTSYEITKVYFDSLNDKDIKNYIASGEPKDKAGSYAIQGRGAVFVKKIEGCYFNVVGLPIWKLVDVLKEFQISVLDNKYKD